MTAGEISEFEIAVFSAGQGKAKGLDALIKLLRSDCPMTSADKSALADYLEKKNAAPTRGRPPERLFSPTWRVQKAVSEIRELSRRNGISMEQATEIVLLGYRWKIEGSSSSALGREFNREQILRELRRSRKPKKKIGN